MTSTGASDLPPRGCKPGWLSREIGEPLYVRCRDLLRAQDRRVAAGRRRRADWEEEISEIIHRWRG